MRSLRSTRSNIAVVVLALSAYLTPAAFSDEPKTAATASQSDVDRERWLYEWREEHDPNGIGKFYMDREIAHVMGFAGATWLERNSREEEERLTLLIRSLNLKPGQVVADIGAGSGVISMLMAERVLPGGTIMAVDIQDEMLQRLKARCEASGIENVIPVKGAIKSPNLKANSIDLAIMVDVYHEFEYPYEMMTAMAAAMKPGGRVVLVEYRMEDPTVPIKLVHKMTQAQAKKEVERPELGLKWTETIDALPRQHIIVFTKQPAEPAAATASGDARP